MKTQSSRLLILLAFVLAYFNSEGQIISSNNFYSIPAQTIFPYKLIESEKKRNLSIDSTFERKLNFSMVMGSINISKQITLSEYKMYLNAILMDSSKIEYIKALPDSSICTKENYHFYLNSNKYDDFPVVGISWESAMNYCKWRTFVENKSNTLEFVYVLPTCSEWLSANSYLASKNIKHDFDLDFSDWLLSLKVDGYFSDDLDFKEYDLVRYPVNDNEFNRTRNFVIGKSYFFEKDKLYKYYSYSYMAKKGYKHIAFRIIKKDITKSVIKNNPFNYLFKFWNLQ